MDLTTRTEEGEWQRTFFEGAINEDAENTLHNLKQSLGPQCIFNFENVKSVNSCGVRAWINFLRDVQKDRKIQFEACTPEIVSQINMIPNFLGTAEIKSVYAEYSCENCGHQMMHLFKQGVDLPESTDVDFPEMKCEKCGSEMEMEEIEEEYFAWLEAG